MKKKISFILLAICFVAMVLVLASCGHEHAYKSEWKSDENNHWHICDVEGEECSEVSGKAAHTFELVEITAAPDCVNKGSQVEKCTTCNYQKTTEIDALGHDLAYSVVPPTCITTGITNVTCNREGCDYETVQDPTPVGDHAWVEATCLEPKTCSVCEVTVGEALGHDHTERVIQPSCTRPGKTVIGCTRCDYSESKDEVPALGHTYNITDDPASGTYSDQVLPTCTEVGQRYFRCTVCRLIPLNDTENNVVEIAPLGHDHYEEVVAPDCVNQGVTEIYCSRCDYFDKKDFVDALGHTTYKENDAQMGVHYLYSVEPNCTEKGEIVYVCTVCDKLSNDKKEIPALDHDFQVVVEPWCGNDSYYEYACSRTCRGEKCTETKAEKADKDIRHKYNEGTVVFPATCVDNGTYACTECSSIFIAYEGDSLGQATGVHVYDSFVQIVSPNCAAEGYTVYGCSAGECGLTENREYTIKTAHTFNEVSEYGTVTCTVCNNSYVDITAEKILGSDTVCFGCGNTPCTCGSSADWEGYVPPKEPMALTPNTELVMNGVTWESGFQPLVLGNGLILLNSDTVSTFTVKIYEASGSAVLHEFVITDYIVMIDLYQYPTVGEVVITSSASATVSFYSIIK